MARASEPAVADVRVAASALSLHKVDMSKEFVDVCGVGRVRRSELEPSDSQPTSAWAQALERLVRLSDAQQRGDEAGISQALYQISQRRRLAVNTRALSATLADTVGPEPTPGEAWALFMAVGTDMASAFDASLSNVGHACRSEGLRDANRRQLCEQVARRMPDMVAEARDSRALHSLEERLGLSHSPQALSREQFKQGSKAISDASMHWMAEPTCANISDMGRQVVLMSRQGEVAWLRAHMKAKSKPASAPQ